MKSYLGSGGTPWIINLAIWYMWMVSLMSRPLHFQRKTPVSIGLKVRWATGQIWTR